MELVNIGAAPNDGSGDPLRDAFDTINDNFLELGGSFTGVYTDFQLADSNLQSQITALDNSTTLAINNLESGLTGTILDLESEIAGSLTVLEGDLTNQILDLDVEIAGSLTVIEGDIADHENRITSAEGDILSLEADKVDRAGDTMSGTLLTPNLFMNVEDAPGYSGGTITLDFEGDGFDTLQVTETTHVLVSNPGRGRSVALRLAHDGTDRAITFDSRIRFLGAKPDTLTANKLSVLSMTSFGTLTGGVIAAYGAEE